MKFLVLALFVAVATAIPVPDDVQNVEMIVNGVEAGQALDLSAVLDLKVHEHVDGELVAMVNPLHPYTAVGIAEAAAAAAAAEPEIEPAILPELIQPEVVPEAAILPEVPQPEVVPEAAVLPVAPQPEVVPEALVLPEVPQPEVVPEAAVLPVAPQPEVVPESLILPEVPQPEVIPEGAVLPELLQPEVEVQPEGSIAPVVPEAVEEAAAPIGQIYNDGTVQVHVNAEDTGVLAYLQGWFNLFVSYVSPSAQTTQQII